MLLSFDSEVKTPLRKGAGSAVQTPVALIPSSSKIFRHLSSGGSEGWPSHGGSFPTAELYSTIVVDTPASVEKGFFATSFDDARKNLFLVSPDHSQGLDQPSSLSLDTSEDSIQSTTLEDTKDVASLILKAEQKLSVVRLSLEKALHTAESIRMLTSADGDQEAAAVDKGEAAEPPIPRPRRALPTPHSIEEEHNLRLVADLVLTPGKTLILSP